MSMFDDGLYYKVVKENSVLFGYLFSEFDELINFENSLKKRIKNYIKETNKSVKSSTFAEDGGGFIFEIKITSNAKS